MKRLGGFRLVIGSAVLVGSIAFGSTFHLPAIAAQEYQHLAVHPHLSCKMPTPCLSEQNIGKGPAIEGRSQGGFGIYGITSFNNTATASAAGIFGFDAATSEVLSNPNAGVLGKSVLGYGVEGVSQAFTAIYGNSAGSSVAIFGTNTGQAAGVEGVSAHDSGVKGLTQSSSTLGSPAAGVIGEDLSSDGGAGNWGVAGVSNTGTGVFGASSGWVGVDAQGGGAQGTIPALSIEGNSSVGAAQDLIDACASINDTPCGHSSASRVATMDSLGNLTIAGRITTSGSCSVGCIEPKGGRSHRVLSYAATQTVPSIEDFGEAQLVNGQAYVRLSRDFANVVDARAAYLVFITPEGDCKVLFVTQKTHDGFTVRESEGGRSSIAFSYRIVAKPYGENAARLPMESLDARSSRRPVLPRLRP
jgi:hypothetical protein